ncbi:unnamed protein product, partial [marine sediment metagenome]
LLTIDHKTPLCRGGTEDDINKQVCCFICNMLKGGLIDKEFRRYYKILQQLKDIYKIKLVINEPKLIFMPWRHPDYKSPEEKTEAMVDKAKQEGVLK